MECLNVLKQVIFNEEVRIFDEIVFYKRNSIGRYKIDDEKISVVIDKNIYVGDPLLIYVGFGQKIDEMKVFNENVSKQDDILVYLLDTKKINIGYINDDEMLINVSLQCLSCLEAINSIKRNVATKGTKSQ